MIRPATRDDAPALVALEEAVFGADAWSAGAVTEELDGPGRRAVVAVEDDLVVGYALTRLAGDAADLTRIAVAPARRRTGVATALIAQVRGLGGRDGAERMLLEVSSANDAALRFYCAEGFARIDVRRGYYRDGTDALVLEAPLQAGGV